MIGTEIGQYRIVEKLGEGSFGIVYKAVDRNLERPVAIKVLRAELTGEPQTLERLRQVVRRMASLSHPNLAAIYGFLVQDGNAAIVMEYVDGPTFERLLTDRGPFPAREAVSLFKPVLLAIGHAHREGILHGDIKPGNFIAGSRVKVMDLGIALALKSGFHLHAGTSAYMSPEQVLNRTMDPRSDIYSLGIALYEMLSGRRPFEGDSDYQVMTDHVNTPAPPPTRFFPDIPRHIESAVLRAIEKRADHRFQSVEEFGAALDDRESEPTPGVSARYAEPASPIAPAPPPPPMEAPRGARPGLSIGDTITRGIEGIGSWLRREWEQAARNPVDVPAAPRAEPAQTAELPGGRVDRVHFTLTAPQLLPPARSSEIYIWAHLDQDRSAVIQRAREAIGESIAVKTKGPVELARGTMLSVRLRIDGLTVENPEETILWAGEIGNAIFIVTVPPGAAGQKTGTAVFYAQGLQIARMHFVVEIGASSSAPVQVPLREERMRKAFASYASPDRDEVLARIQGIQKAAPSLEIFLDVLALRSGQDWEQQLWQRIPESDVFYLFWSANAKNSTWVEKEWRCALETRGLEFIDPVPLVAPELAPPPAELSSKHFNDWVLAFRRKP